MVKKILSIIVLLSVTSIAVTASPPSKSEKEVRYAAEIRNAVLKLGVGPEVRVKVILLDKTKLKGYLSAADSEKLTIVNQKTGLTTEVPYEQVRMIKGRNTLTGGDILAGIGLAWLGLIVILCATTSTCMN